MSFWVKTKWIVKVLFPKYIWKIPVRNKIVYLTFDDGPTPEITEWVLEHLNNYSAKATFFCIGNNIEKHPEIFEKIKSAGHSVGNHTYNHLKGWNTPNSIYLADVKKCNENLDYYRGGNDKQKLFRPPYGKIKRKQANAILKLGYKIIMWDVLSMDFDESITSEQCLANVLNNVSSGSVIVFHDSLKAKAHLQFVLPKTLAYLHEQQYVCNAIGN
ncbi:MAG: Peptidoglycan-N-acetylglucosamine deacetylase [Bacteroidota bacterium]|jgi:peptidoglycan/xylan/chitin deacetylase (PgdA/CDA1 family)